MGCCCALAYGFFFLHTFWVDWLVSLIVTLVDPSYIMNAFFFFRIGGGENKSRGVSVFHSGRVFFFYTHTERKNSDNELRHWPLTTGDRAT
jgi:hypothetical protein